MFAMIALISLGLLGSVFIGSDDHSATESSEEDLECDAVEEPTLHDDVQIVDVGELLEIDAFEDETQNSSVLSELELDEDVLKGRNLIIGGLQGDILSGAEGELIESDDHLFGQEGNDILVGGDGDVLIGGNGCDRFIVNEDSEVVILDFEEDEVLVIQYAGQPPVITGDATDTGVSILADGLLVAQLESVYHFELSRILLEELPSKVP